MEKKRTLLVLASTFPHWDSGLITFMKTILNKINKTPLHPQWLLFRDEKQLFKIIAAIATKTVLDIGCSTLHLSKGE